MTLYSRPARDEYLMWPLYPSNRKWERYVGTNYVTKPIRAEITPYNKKECMQELLQAGWNAYAVHKYPAVATSLPYSQAYYGTGLYTSLRAEAKNRAYSRLVAVLKGETFGRDEEGNRISLGGGSAELGVNLAERKQAISMIANRATHLITAYRDLRRGDFLSFLSRFNLKPTRKSRKKWTGNPRGRWSKPKDASSIWLEYHFGWSPLLGDIYAAADLLQSPIMKDWKFARVSATSGAYYEHYKTGTYQYLTGTLKVRCRTGTYYRVFSDNLYRANQLGLVNPATIGWELIPFSFVVDWFIPVGQFLNSYTDLWGLEFQNPWSSYLSTFDTKIDYQWDYSDGRYGTTHSSRGFVYERVKGIVQPVIYPKAFKGLSVTRAATAISLLIQVFKP